MMNFQFSIFIIQFNSILPYTTGKAKAAVLPCRMRLRLLMQAMQLHPGVCG
jgi:hypothetical protein